MGIQTNEPSFIRAGDTLAWRREDLSDYPATAGWTLKYYFRNATHKFAITATSSGDAYAVSVAMATTAGYTVGKYDWLAVVESATERHEVDTGRIEVLPNLATDAVYDARSFARKMLEIIEAALLTRASADQLDLLNATLDGRGIQRDKAGLMTLRTEFQAEVRAETDAERIRNGGAARNKLLAVL